MKWVSHPTFFSNYTLNSFLAKPANSKRSSCLSTCSRNYRVGKHGRNNYLRTLSRRSTLRAFHGCAHLYWYDNVITSPRIVATFPNLRLHGTFQVAVQSDSVDYALSPPFPQLSAILSNEKLSKSTCKTFRVMLRVGNGWTVFVRSALTSSLMGLCSFVFIDQVGSPWIANIRVVQNTRERLKNRFEISINETTMSVFHYATDLSKSNGCK